jgi:tryptophan synthase alpha subunit
MAKRIEAAFAKKPAFVGYITGGFPTAADTVPAMLAMQASGVDVIEVRVHGAHDTYLMRAS